MVKLATDHVLGYDNLGACVISCVSLVIALSTIPLPDALSMRVLPCSYFDY